LNFQNKVPNKIIEVKPSALMQLGSIVCDGPDTIVNDRQIKYKGNYINELI